MASPHLADDDHSDYGSDFSPEQEELADRLLAAANLDETRDIEDIRDTRQYAPHARLPKSPGLGLDKSWTLSREDGSVDLGFTAKITEPSIVSPQDNTSRVKRSHGDELAADFTQSLVAANKLEPLITKSPLERFRNAKNKRALSVTDLISTSWCELQYFYQMRTGKKKRRTPAMKQGSNIHAALEEQISKPVVVTTSTRHDQWALRFWNVIQGLKTLRETGITRELEVWGTIGGVTVNGVIDELSYTCPDNDLEYDLRLQEADELHSSKDYHYPRNSIAQFYRQCQEYSSETECTSGDAKKVYITDVKTRNSTSLPSNTAFRPTKMQLMLYHHLLLKLSTGAVDFALVAASYDLDTANAFSDAFVAEMASIQDSPVTNVDAENDVHDDDGDDALAILLANNNLSLLWNRMIREFQKTFPRGRKSLGNVLQAEYRAPSLVSEVGRVLGSKTFPMSEAVLLEYIDYEMRFWRGERPPVGVLLSEAWKCGYCDFAAACEWRKEREDEMLGAATKASGDGGDDRVNAAGKGKWVEIVGEADAMEGVELSDDASLVPATGDPSLDPKSALFEDGSPRPGNAGIEAAGSDEVTDDGPTMPAVISSDRLPVPPSTAKRTSLPSPTPEQDTSHVFPHEATSLHRSTADKLDSENKETDAAIPPKRGRGRPKKAAAEKQTKDKEEGKGKGKAKPKAKGSSRKDAGKAKRS